MKRATLRSRDLLEATEIIKDDEIEAPEEYWPVLITGAMKCVYSPALANHLREKGHDVSDKMAATWLQSARKWLGIPPAGRGKFSDGYRRTVKKWCEDNGNPTPEDVDAGWVPAHRRKQGIRQPKELSPFHMRDIEEFRGMLKSLDEAIDDNHARELLAEFQETIKTGSIRN